ncbi:DoxX family protein [Pseudomonas lalucatii]|uniref:DoxX family protein n=1 Tax=Pseudomonas lalucatii TaxID=1424203 RepID=A0ABS5PWZ0_9PSED|nr:DoxX family protein [Pseudomonas lalucatii]MBS7660998.1 DoxX family protein [Pseudomonas lalucatii]MBS7691549.1 DoxX family protein [Pseudomonas lalucatii]MBS7724334.1 DoxX family protein [Pseudomonas lalucatii]QVM87675.1 DoxX family protein [Pseudomonas lalucatii]
MNNAIVLLARLLLAHIFVLAGINKIGGFAGTQGYMESMGVPGVLLPLVILLEVGGGLALIFGFLTRWAALALAAFSVAAALIFHTNFAEQMQMILFMKNFSMAGGLLLLYVHGAGAFSIDAMRGR